MSCCTTIKQPRLIPHLVSQRSTCRLIIQFSCVLVRRAHVRADLEASIFRVLRANLNRHRRALHRWANIMGVAPALTVSEYEATYLSVDSLFGRSHR